jgi:hypothetical protein
MLPIRILKPSFPMPPLVEIVQWRPMHSDDAGLAWMRATVHEVVFATL